MNLTEQNKTKEEEKREKKKESRRAKEVYDLRNRNENSEWNEKRHTSNDMPSNSI